MLSNFQMKAAFTKLARKSVAISGVMEHYDEVEADNFQMKTAMESLKQEVEEMRQELEDPNPSKMSKRRRTFAGGNADVEAAKLEHEKEVAKLQREIEDARIEKAATEEKCREQMEALELKVDLERQEFQEVMADMKTDLAAAQTEVEKKK